MSELENTQEQTENVETPQDDQSSGGHFARLREKNQTLEQRLAELESANRMMVFEKAGLDPANDGMAKAIYQLYDGPVNVNEIKNFAAENYGWKGAASTHVSEAQSRADAVIGQSVDEAPQNLLAQAEEAAASGDIQKSAALKDQYLRSLLKQ